MIHQPYTEADFNLHPLMFYYEVTRACDLVCKHCRASAQEDAAPDELSTENGLKLIDQIAQFKRKPTICFTGGDPLKRNDLFKLIRRASDHGITSALTPSATPLATFDAFQKAKDAGISAVGLSIDGPNPEVHDAFRGFSGSFAKALEMLDYARKLDLPVQVNTSVTRRNVGLIDEIAEMLEGHSVRMWSVFFLVPVGRGVEEVRITPKEYIEVFEKLWHHAQTKSYAVKTTEAPHYRRYVLQQGGNPLAGPGRHGTGTMTGSNERARAPLGVTDGRGIMFCGHNGEIFPAGFLPIVCGKFPEDSVIDIYQNHPLFQALHNPDNYKGICGSCDYRRVCGGSRSRAYALTGDPLEAEPDCAFEPPKN